MKKREREKILDKIPSFIAECIDRCNYITTLSPFLGMKKKKMKKKQKE